MTRDEVLAMPAGREMDKVVCETTGISGKVEFYAQAPGLGHEGAGWMFGTFTQVSEEVRRMNDAHPYSWTAGSTVERITHFPPVSTDIAAAWPLAVRFGIAVVHSDDGVYAGKPDDIEHGHVRGTDVPTLTLHMREHERWEPAETAPLAICRAALLGSIVSPPYDVIQEVVRGTL